MAKIFLIIFLAFTSTVFSQYNESIYLQNRETVEAFFRSESIGGSMDFELKMQDDESPYYLIEKVMYNRKDYSILLWAAAIKKTEKFSKKEAMNLWEEIRNRKLTKPERKTFLKGFKMQMKQGRKTLKND